MELFGWKINWEKEDPNKTDSLPSFVPPQKDDGAANIAAGGTTGTYIDLDGTVKTEAELVERYRSMSLQPEVDKAINEITNEAIVKEEDQDIVSINLEEAKLQDSTKKLIQEEFKELLDILEFNKMGYDIFRRWYIDGRAYFHIVIDYANPQEGIKELRYVDPRKIRKIREIAKVRDPASGAILQRTKNEYYIFNERGFSAGSKAVLSTYGTSGVKIKKDAIVHITSGLMDNNNTTVLSYLHPAIKLLNELRALEDASIIYHLSRAPERRVFNVDVGNLPKHKAEEHVRRMMVQHKNKLTYNAVTGEISDTRKFATMLEDYWLPKRADGSGTTIDVLQGGTALNDLLNSIEYFQDRLFRALQVPLTRMKPDAIYNIGRATEITRDEVNFQKFIDRLRNKFSELFLIALERQLILKEITSPDDWIEIKQHIRFEFAKDNYFSELKESELYGERFMRLNDVAQYAGIYYSNQWIRRNILKQTDGEIELLDKQMKEEENDPKYQNIVPGQGAMSPYTQGQQAAALDQQLSGDQDNGQNTQ